MITILLVAALTAASTAAGQTGKSPVGRSAKLLLDPAAPVHDLNVAYAFTTTVWFPVNCRSVTVGDPETFVALIDERFKNRVVITPQVEALGARSNITVDCEQDVRVVLALTLTDVATASQIVEFEFSKEDMALVRSAVEEERKRCAAEAMAKATELRTALEQEATERLLRSVLRRFGANDDTEYVRQDFVILKVFRQIIIGGKAIIVFQIDNRSSKDFVVHEVMVEDANGQPVTGLTFSTPERRVSPDSAVQGVVAFDTIAEVGAMTLSISEDGPRVLRVQDIDF